MKKAKNYQDSDYDYSDSIKPITYEIVRETIVESLKNFEFGEDENDARDINDPEVQRDIDQLTKRVMFGFWANLAYFEENYECDLERIVNGDFD